MMVAWWEATGRIQQDGQDHGTEGQDAADIKEGRAEALTSASAAFILPIRAVILCILFESSFARHYPGIRRR